ncbi:hypothetical protein CK203_045015 [Vitis vinifera]|uniref:Uncharacterized protein n=1 Tax=Vitis vinifera TaxID=29760 RepID=A0A438HWW2_VITVI|nr:hypothetical protein CK203_045015 [Vitis vinifera]
MFSMCFPEEVPDYDLPMDLGYGTDEMDMIGIGRIFDAAPHEPHTVFDMFRVFVLETDEDDSILDAYTDDMDFIGIGHILDAAPRPNFTRFRYSLGAFSVLARTLLWYSPGVFLVLARSLLRYSPGAFSVLARTLLRYLPGTFSGTRPNPSPVLARILPVFGTRPDSTIFRYLPEPFSGTCPDQIPNLSRHHDRVSFYLSPASCLDPIVHSVSMTYFP